MLHTMSPTGRFVLPLLLFLVLPVAGLRAQQASLTGRVVDSSGRRPVVRDIAFSQTSTLQFRAECFNLFNRVNFNQPNVNSLRGVRAHHERDGRCVQFGVKLYSSPTGIHL